MLALLYFSIPPTAIEADVENVEYAEPKIIPLEDVSITASIENILNFTTSVLSLIYRKMVPKSMTTHSLLQIIMLSFHWHRK